MICKLIGTAAALVAAVSFRLPAPPTVSAASAIVMDADTGAVLYEEAADVQSRIASTTKIMTALVALESLLLSDEFTVPAEACNIEGSSIYLKPNQTVTIETLLYGLMLESGNDAAVALAYACCGDVEQFVQRMNETAHRLGLKNTHFDNPNGLDSPTHYSTARDLAALSAYALKNESFVQIVSTKSITRDGISMRNHNRLLWSCEGVFGIKTGYTKAAGRILVSAAQRDDRRLIVVTIRDGNDWQDHAALYDYGFSNYDREVAIRAGQYAFSLPTMDGESVRLYVREDFSFELTSGERLTLCPCEPKYTFSAGVFGTEAGCAWVMLGTRPVGKVHLLWGETDHAASEDHIGTWRCIPSRSGNAAA